MFREGLAYGAAPVMAGETESVILVFADQQLPEEYVPVAEPEDNISPYAAAFVLSSVKKEGSIPIDPCSSLEALIGKLKAEASCV